MAEDERSLGEWLDAIDDSKLLDKVDVLKDMCKRLWSLFDQHCKRKSEVWPDGMRHDIRELENRVAKLEKRQFCEALDRDAMKPLGLGMKVGVAKAREEEPIGYDRNATSLYVGDEVRSVYGETKPITIAGRRDATWLAVEESGSGIDPRWFVLWKRKGA